MQSYTQVYQFGQQLLIPTMMNDQTVRLFAIDTGSSASLLSLRAAKEFTKVHCESNIQVEGLSGRVAKVYTTDHALLQFGSLRQKDQTLVTFDLSGLSDDVGTEVSGILGMTTLYLLDIRIDYRDGIVDFKYNPKP
jgi:hypothetical protein